MRKILLLVCLLFCLNGCDFSNVPFVNPEETPEISFEYQPPFVPVSFVFGENGVTIATGVSMVTPIGRFGLNADYPVAEFGQVTLVLRDRTAEQNNVYHVIVEDEVRILLEGRAEVSLNREGVMTVDITEGNLAAITFTDQEQPVGIASARQAVAPITVNLNETGEVSLSR